MTITQIQYPIRIVNRNDIHHDDVDIYPKRSYSIVCPIERSNSIVCPIGSAFTVRAICNAFCDGNLWNHILLFLYHNFQNLKQNCLRLGSFSNVMNAGPAGMRVSVSVVGYRRSSLAAATGARDRACTLSLVLEHATYDLHKYWERPMVNTSVMGYVTCSRLTERLG